jgi:hypothetical protein
MAEISISLNMLDVSSTVVQLGEEKSLRDQLPELLDAAGVHGLTGDALDQCLVLVNRPVTQLERTLNELGARTGDMLSILPRSAARPGQGALPILFNVLSDSGDTLEISDHVAFGELLPALIRHFKPEVGGSSLDQYLIALGRPVSRSQSLPSELGIRPGDVLSLLQVRFQSSQVALILASPRDVHAPFRVNYSPAVMGRFDRNLADQPLDIDLSRVLPRRKERAVSRRQAEFVEENGIWSVHLHPDSRVPMFVDNQRLLLEQPLIIAENNVLSFGPGPNHPDFQLVVRFETD